MIVLSDSFAEPPSRPRTVVPPRVVLESVPSIRLLHAALCRSLQGGRGIEALMQRGRADEVGEDDDHDLEEALEDAVSLFGGELLGQGMERGGEGGIRTPGTLAGTPDFESRYAVYCGVRSITPRYA